MNFEGPDENNLVLNLYMCREDQEGWLRHQASRVMEEKQNDLSNFLTKYHQPLARQPGQMSHVLEF